MSKVSFVGSLSLSLALISLRAAAAPATPEELDAAGVVAVEAVAVELPAERSELAEHVALALRKRIGGSEGVPAGALLARDRTVHVELRPGPVPEGGDVMIRVEGRVEGRMIAESSREICVACNDAEVAERAFPLVWDLLVTFPEPAKQSAKPQAFTEHTDDGQGEGPGRAPNRAMRVAGAGMLGVGLATLATGVALIVVDEAVVSPIGAGQLELIEYRPSGIAVTVVGAAATITGAVLLGLAFRPSSRRLALAPALSPGFVGVGAFARF